MSHLSEILREEFKRSDDNRDAGLTTPEEVCRWDDIRYGADARWQSLDVYRPREAGTEKLPVIVSVHGGGWVYGDKERYQFYCMELARRGFAVVNYSYRLAPEHKFPAALEDANAVFGWVLANAERYGFDPERVFAVGDSAGAQMLGLYACMCVDRAYAAEYDFRPPEGFVPKGVALNCGVYRIAGEAGGADDLTSRLMAELLPMGGTPEELARVDVLRHVSPGFPPAFVMTSNGDFLKAQVPALAQKLIEVGTPFELHVYGDAAHELGHVFHCDVRSEYARRCNDDECAFFRSLC